MLSVAILADVRSAALPRSAAKFMAGARPIAFIIWLAEALSAIRWDPTVRQYVDDAGRARLFHGVNVVYKREPWYPPYIPIDSDKSLGDADMKDLRMWGHNVVRRVERFDRRGTEPFEPFEFFQNRNFPEFSLENSKISENFNIF